MINSPTYIIAEAGVNHNGSIDTAIKMIDVAAEAGADAVKFQTFIAKQSISRTAPKAEYQKRATGNFESQYEMVKKLELGYEEHRAMIEHCKKRQIQFLSTPFDFESLQMLVDELKVPILKIASGEITNAPLLLKTARTGKPVILSTGMSTLSDIETALGVLAFGYLNHDIRPTLCAFEDAYISDEGIKILKDKVTLLHCTTEYPAPFEEVHLNTMATLKASFGLPVGLSDHTLGIAIPVAAVSLGACIIEKHFTLDKNDIGPDHKASLEPDELRLMISSIRQVEKALGMQYKKPSGVEMRNRMIARKSLVAASNITKGEQFSEKNIAIKRPGDGVPPVKYWDFIGEVALKNYREDEKL